MIVLYKVITLIIIQKRAPTDFEILFEEKAIIKAKKVSIA